MQLDDNVIIPSRDSGYTFLSRTPTGKLFRKHILNKGTLYHPATGEPVEIDDAFIATMKRNFDNKVCDIVQFPLAGKNNEHVENPEANAGEIIDIQEEGNKVYAVIDARKPEVAESLGKTILGASAMLSLNYKDTKTNDRVGPTLLHVCATNRPYVTELEDYEEIVAASAVSNNEVVFLTDEVENKMATKEELLAALKEHGIDVAALQAKADESSASAQKVTELEAKVAEDETARTQLEAKVAEGEKVAATVTALLSQLDKDGVIKLSGEPAADDITKDDIKDAIVQLAHTNTTLHSRIDKLELTNAEAEVDKLVSEGKVLPVQRDTFVELRMSNVEMFNKLVPETPIVKMSVESGVTPDEREQKEKAEAEEIARLTSLVGDLK